MIPMMYMKQIDEKLLKKLMNLW